MEVYLRCNVSTVNFPLREAESYLDLDSHADTCVLGNNALLIESDYPERTAVVSFADPSVGTVTKKIVSGAFLYTSPRDGAAHILVVHQAIHIETMEHSLLCPMQLRDNDVLLDECPKCKTDNPTVDTHTIRALDEHDNEIRIPLTLRGVSSTVNISTPTIKQYHELPHVTLTSRDTTWDPHNEDYQEQEESFFDSLGEFIMPGTKKRAYDKYVLHTVNSSKTKAKNLISLQAVNNIKDRMHYMGKEEAVLNNIDPALNDGFLLRSMQANRLVPKERKLGSTSTRRRKGLMPEHLSKTWKITLRQAENTIRVTTQRGIRNIANPALSRRFKTNDRMLRYRRVPHTIFTDTLKSRVKSKNQNTHAQVYCTDFHWTRAYPMQKESEAHHTLSKLFKDVGVPDTMVMDGAKAQTLGNFRRKLKEADCRIKQTEPYTPFSNAAEAGIRELKKATGRRLTKTRSPKRLWDDCMELESLIRSHTALDIWQLQGQVPQTLMTGQTADISQLFELGWYDWCYYHDSAIKFPNDKLILGRWLGPSIDVGPAMTGKILKPNGNTRHVSTYRALTDEELEDPLVKQEMIEFDAAIRESLGPAAEEADFVDEFEEFHTPTFEPYSDKQDMPPTIPDREDFEGFDEYIGAEVVLPIEGLQKTGTVRARKRNTEGSLKGTKHANPLFDTRAYVVEFPNGMEAEYTANLIAENMYAQCNIDGEQYLLLEGIIDHKTNSNAVEKADGYITVNNRRCAKKTTKGWHLCIEWKDGTTSWERLATLKESNPVEVAEYAVARGIEDEPAFKWWVPFTLNKRDSIIAKVNTRYHKRTHKFGFEVPKTVEDALRIDKANGDDRWSKAIAKEMSKVRVAFRILQDGEKAPVGHSFIGVHMIFDVKMENFQFKARLVANGNETGAPASLTYASVVSRESVRIALTMAALNGLEVKTSDVENAFLTAPTEEKLYTVLGPEFGDDKGKTAVIKRALYGTKSAGASFRNHLADCMSYLGYKPCPADPDVWTKRFTKPDGTKYYGYMLLYVDDAMCINHDATAELLKLDAHFKMKPGSIGDPDIYLGAKITDFKIDGYGPDEIVRAWGMSPTKYVTTAINNVEDYLAKQGKSLEKRDVRAPFRTGYRPELDLSPELNDKDCTNYQSHVGILRWMVELGRTDIITEVSELASQLAMPREGHLEAVYRIYAYLKYKRNTLMLFDPSYPTIDNEKFQKRDWNNFYGRVEEILPPDMLEPLGGEVILRLFVDADYAGDNSNRRSRTGFFVFLNEAPIAWFSKKQTRVENSVFGSEFIAMRTGLETVQGIRYKLRMMGIPLNTPTYIYGDNMSVIHNTSKPESTLKKKANSVCYYYIREAVAADECRTGHISTSENPADVATKPLPAGEKRDYLNSKILHFFDTATTI